ncbi:MAG TPA: glycosyltransferase family 39 protein [Pseudonocardia sp.]|nr:glycosyltransferase family 39 protein [Pseudonocardia sp.]
MSNSPSALARPRNKVRTAAATPSSGPAREPEPRWTRPAFWALLLVTAVTYLWNLGASGFANDYYAAAVQAGTQSWKALLFGSLDSAGAITVDKPPASLWVMGLSGRIFGFSSWSMLAPQALMGVASVALLYAAVRRWSGPKVALAAGAVLAFTPAAVLMFRFNNPDALLVLLMTAAAYTCVRAVDAAATRSGTRWLLLTGTLIGFGFLTKMLQAMLVVPALALVYLLVADTPVRRRIGQLLGAGAAMVVSAGWYVALVQVWPASSRPYIGGSDGNSLLELALGYNGLGRIFGGAGNGGPGDGGPGDAPSGPPPGMEMGAGFGGPGGPGGTGFGGTAGITRMFNTSFGGNISWLLPAALIVLVAGLWLTRGAPRTDRTRAGLLLWGGWLLVNGLVFSFMSGTIHPYYSVAMAPGLAGVLAVGAGAFWSRRERWAPRLVLVVALAATAGWSVVLLDRTPTFLPWLRWVVIAGGVLGASVLLLPPRRLGRAVVVVALLGALAGSAGSTAYAVQTALTAHQGSIISAGPSTGGDGFPGGAPGGSGDGSRTGDGARADGMRRGGPGAVSNDPALTALLRNAGTKWAAATVSAQGAAGLELSSGTAVMAIGGFTGSDPAPTLEQFQAWVAQGQVHYFIASNGGPGGPGGPGGAGGPGGSSGVGAKIRTWVQQHYTATTVGGETVYDLTAPTTG